MKSTMGYITILFLLLACGTWPGVQTGLVNVDGTPDAESNGTISKMLDPNLLAKFGNTAELPFKSDSVYFDNLTTQSYSALTSIEVKQLMPEFLEADFSSQALWDLRNFYQIDSLKNIGEYENYVETLEIGMMKESDAYVDQKIVVDEKTTLL